MNSQIWTEFVESKKKLKDLENLTKNKTEILVNLEKEE